MVSRIRDFVIRAFELPVDERLFRRTVEACRILIGLGMVHRYVDIGGFLTMAPHAGLAERDVVVATLVGAAVTFGFLTPLALAGLLYFTLHTPFGFTLAHQIVALVAWILLFSGAGQKMSADAQLLRLPGLSHVVRSMYVLAVPFSTRTYAVMRLIVLWLFWSIAWGAMSFHFRDELWLRGNVLQLLFVTPYMTDFAEATAAFRDGAPGLYGFLCRTALGVQAVFEFLLWPLCLFRWGRIFVAVQWFGFIAVRGLFMNLGYLCYDELVLWLFVFTLQPWAVWQHRVSGGPLGPESHQTRKKGFAVAVLHTFALLGVVVSVYFNVTNFARLNAPGSAVARAPLPSTLFRIFGQWPVDVFNKADMSLGAAHLVLVELDEQGGVLRIVPYLDDDGGRLSYLRNDFMYYGVSLPWQRLPRDLQIRQAPTLARRVALLDASLTSGKPERHYAALLFTRTVEPFATYQKWSDAAFHGGLRFALSEDDVRNQRPPTLAAYDLPPGHVGQQYRASRTLSRVRQLWNEGALESLTVAVWPLAPNGGNR